MFTDDELRAIEGRWGSCAPFAHDPVVARWLHEACTDIRALLAEVGRLQDQVRAHAALRRDSTAHAVGYARALADAAEVCADRARAWERLVRERSQGFGHPGERLAEAMDCASEIRARGPARAVKEKP